MTTVLIAPDKFKGTLTAAQVCAAVGKGLLRRDPDARVLTTPVADGGDGTVAAALEAGFERVPVVAVGPTGEPATTSYARRDDDAVVELADVCGLVRLPDGRPAPRTATSRGVGDVIAAAVDNGCRKIVLAIGGSASTDGGAGMVQALGARLLDADGQPISAGGSALASLATIDLEPLTDRMRGVQVTVACDVDNPLTGPYGAAAIYGPQKGATPVDVDELDAALGLFADRVSDVTGQDHRGDPGAGAAGGVGFAAIALLGATLRPGIDLMLELVGFHEHLPDAHLVITGEGSLDSQTLHGKAPAGVAAAARAAGVPVVAVCGRSTLTAGELRRSGIEQVYALTDIEPDVSVCMTHGDTLLVRLGERIAIEHLGRTSYATERD